MVVRVVVTDPDDDAEDQTFGVPAAGQLPPNAAAVLTTPELERGNVVARDSAAWDEPSLDGSNTATETETETETGRRQRQKPNRQGSELRRFLRSSARGVRAVGYWTVTQRWTYPSASSAVGVSGASPR